jgi:predicted metal-binding protein
MLEDLERYLAEALAGGADDAIIVKTAQIRTAPWVRMKCQFGCPGYGERLCCPPYTPDEQKMRAILDSYERGILLHRHVTKGYGPIDDLNRLVVDLERTLFLAGFYKAWALGSGPCTQCEACNLTGQCIHPKSARPSMEGCGIDVFGTVREQSLPIEVVRNHSQSRNVYALLLVD